MARVHGDIQIKRRTDIKQYKDYHMYRPYLVKDFQGICGYCGKSIDVIKDAFEIDHFVPVNFDKSKKCTYSNLVFSCKKCNRAKSDKWPTEDSNIFNNGIEGFVDPASEEFDNHIQRDQSGKIYGITQVGKYMCENLNFNIRPIDIIWKAMELHKRARILSEKIEDKHAVEDYKNYYEITENLNGLLHMLLNEKTK